MKVLSVYNNITETTIPSESFYLMNYEGLSKDVLVLKSHIVEVTAVTNGYQGGGISNIFALGKLGLLRKLMRFYSIVRSDYDIIHCHHTLSSFLVITFTKWKSKSKILFTLHNDYRYFKSYQKVLIKFVVSRADFVVFNSYNTRSSLGSIPYKSGSVIYNGVDGSRISLSKGFDGKIRFLSVGRLIPQKNLSVIIEGFVKAVNRGMDGELVIVGDGKEAALLRARSKESGCGERIHFRGRLSRGEVYSEMSKAHVFVVSSKFEGFCNAMVEAMMAGLLPVVANVEPLPEVAGGDLRAIFFDPDSATDLTNIMLKLKDYSSAEKLRDEAKVYARDKYAIEKCAHEYYNAYLSLVNCG